MSKIIICRGIPASGKSTWAKSWVAEDPTHRARFNWDDMRNMMGPYWVPERENTGVLKTMRIAFLNTLMGKGWDIVVDNMNLNPKESAFFEDVIKEHNTKNPANVYTLEYQDFFTPVDVCIARDAKRENPIGEKVIRDIWRRYKQDIWQRESIRKMDSLRTYRSDKRDCIIVDMDGTLAFNTHGRPYYGEGTAEGIKFDVPLNSTISIVRSMKMTGTCDVFIVTGRDETVRKATEEWLKTYSVPFDKIYMRADKDYRKGSTVKQELLNQILTDHNVLFVLDDDEKCKNMYQANGIICLQP